MIAGWTNNISTTYLKSPNFVIKTVPKEFENLFTTRRLHYVYTCRKAFILEKVCLLSLTHNRKGQEDPITPDVYQTWRYFDWWRHDDGDGCADRVGAWRRGEYNCPLRVEPWIKHTVPTYRLWHWIVWSDKRDTYAVTPAYSSVHVSSPSPHIRK